MSSLDNFVEKSHDVQTQEISERFLTDEEIETILIERNNELAKIAKQLEAAAEKAAEKAALLAKLGITEDDAKLLLS